MADPIPNPEPTLQWLLEDDETGSMLEQFSGQPPRIAVIVIGSILDDRLEVAIRSRLIKDERTLKPLFRGYGPLASFSVKISLAYLLQIYGPETHRDFHTIRKIRNEFAHTKHMLEFSSQKNTSSM